MNKDFADAFTHGYVAAVTNLVMLHDQPTMARDLLNQLGKVDWRRISAYDRHILKQAGIYPPSRRNE